LQLTTHPWDIYSDIQGLKFNAIVSGNNIQRMVISGTGLDVNGTVTANALNAESATITGNLSVSGIDLGEMNAILLQKVEELTLYIIQMEKRLAEVENLKGGTE